jgi:hypothetical protein
MYNPIIRTLYTDPMHWNIILTQLYVHCIPILCTWTLYLPNYTYVVYRSNALWHYTYPIIQTLYINPMNLDIILTQLYERCILILCTWRLYLPNYTYVVYRSYALGHYTYPIIRTLYTDPMHFDIILIQLYVRCIPILCTWRLYLPNYTYIVYRSYALGDYTYPIIRTLYTNLCTCTLYLPNYTYVVYRSYALGHYTYPIIRTLYTDPMRTLYTDPMHLDIILTQLYVRCIPILCTWTLYLPNYTYVVYRSNALGDYTYPIIRTLYTDPMHWNIILTQLYVRCIPIKCTGTLYLLNYTYVVYLYLLNYTYVVYRSNALEHYTYPIIRTSYTDRMHLDIISNRTLYFTISLKADWCGTGQGIIWSIWIITI